MKRFPADCASLIFAAWQLVIGSACVVVGMLLFETVPLPRTLSQPVLLAFIYHALLGQALASVLWFEVVTKIPAAIAALGTLTVPAIGVIGAVLMLGERPSFNDYLGLGLVIAASSTVLLPARRLPR